MGSQKKSPELKKPMVTTVSGSRFTLPKSAASNVE
jgi:hypothetical protein|eukprot:CAMPEP_0119208278 /NCGR_PEP_ID=MMETSP1327-20130426/519_1 /TAXON_ID=38833 /ORGANISM="Micromonas pusilla, Strain RCC2306" /LENGTH=34 /DNA_ID= /DNA_START= /DNA_END= /DNA_ORIENTATION=